ncbi:caprin-1-like [Tachypleus tridentatus]|uniref:caprin-1-like n=1 Tax=Tachypleus tridentatus TaxID=6853 RepID=UPI003FD3906B
MPSASCKLEKRMVIVEASDPVKQIINILEKKIRKLVKKKGKLDVCKNELSEGKELNEDQLKAIGKYDQVVGVLEFSNDLLQVFSSIDRDVRR